MNAIKLLCCLLLLSGLACKHQTASLVQDKDFQCNKLVDEIIVAERAFIAALKSVQDIDTANEAAVKIREAAGRFDEISEKFARLGPLSEELKLRLLNKLELEDRRERANPLEGARIFTPEEAKIITPAAELFFEKFGAVTMKSGLYYNNSEYNATAPH
jgi:hypothetical protein